MLFAFTPIAHPSPALAIAASRYGAVGVFDAGAGRARDCVSAALSQLAREARNPFGAAFSMGADSDWIDDLVPLVGAGLDWLVLDLQTALAWWGGLAPLRREGVKVLVEMDHWDAAEIEPLADADGWLVKGHEAGGRVGEETSFILLQRFLAQDMGPVYVRGGIGLHTAAACHAAGADGVVFDNQLLLLRESPLRKTLAPAFKSLVGNETILIGDPADGPCFRILNRPGFTAAQALRDQSQGLAAAELVDAVSTVCGWDDTREQVLPVGQDIAFAAPWAERFERVSGLLRAVEQAIDGHLEQAAKDNALAADSPLAKSHGTKYPVVQGPMTRVSDVAGFAKAVADAGGLPMVALALMRGEALKKAVRESRESLAGRSWGIGILGFAPADLREEQVAVSLEHKPTFAIIAGGRPDQALALEQQGIVSFLHVPSPRLLGMFLEQGARRFIFEGRECGGHIGPLSSFVLWESMVDTLLDEVTDASLAQEIHLLFAGGVHDALSAAMVATLAAPLTARGMRVGVLLGTGYLFTREIVDSGAILPAFQDEAVRCERTVSLESGPGHSSRGAYTPFARQFLDLKRDLIAKGEGAETIREALDDFNLGRLRIASKGIERVGNELAQVPEERQRAEGMYMIGQAAALESEVVSVADLHRKVTQDACDLIASRAAGLAPAVPTAAVSSPPADIAVIGIGVCLPGATDVRGFWHNLIEAVDQIGEIPAHRWDWRLYFDEERATPDKIYSRWGGFLDDMPFDPLKYGLPPRAIKHLDPVQLMSLEVVARTLADAGYADRPFDRERASVILGASGGVGDVGCKYAVRSETPRFAGELPQAMAERLPEWTEDTFAGILLNVTAGRAANRFDFGGVNFIVDSACASSLTAIYQSVIELEDKRSDLVIAGGVDTVQGPFGYLCFSKTQALSPRGRCRTFDATADGIVISEGIAMVALKRLEDAERDGDRIYAVIKGYGGSSDGRARSMTAPHPDGQMRALQRAYDKAGYGPQTVDLFEAHGTGTVAGDTAELETVTRILQGAGAMPRQSAIGSAKTLIGHTKASAGVAGFVKAVLALHHRVLPPHANVEQPNARLADPNNPLYLVRDAQPWVAHAKYPRRASVSAFGFGGTNFHLAMEEYRGTYLQDQKTAVLDRWPRELYLWRATDRDGLIGELERLSTALVQAPDDLALRDLAYSLARKGGEGRERLAIVADTAGELRERIVAVIAHLKDSASALPPGCHFDAEPVCPDGGSGTLALLFSGQGSQYPDMLREVAILFPEMGEALDEAESLLGPILDDDDPQAPRFVHRIYPPGRYDDAQEKAAAKLLMRTDNAQPALGVIEAGLWALLQRMGILPAMAAGHSYGEYAALFAAGVLDRAALLRLSAARGRCIIQAAAGNDLGTMAAVAAPREMVDELLQEAPELVLANHNGPTQSVVSGSTTAIDAFVSRLQAQSVSVRKVPVAAAFHSPLVAPAKEALAESIASEAFTPPAFPVYSNTTGQAHSEDPAAIRRAMAEHLVRGVEFVAEVEAMYEAGARLFLEVGPKSVLTRMAGAILGDRRHRAVAIDDGAGGLKGLLDALGVLWSQGVELDPGPLFEGRDCRSLDLDDLRTASRAPDLAPHMWWLNGSGARPFSEPPTPVLTIEEVQAQQARAPVQESAPPVPPPQHAGMGNQAPVAGPQGPFTTEEKTSMPESHLPAVHSPPDLVPGAMQDGGDAVWSAYYETMRQFLLVQESVMLAYLSGGGGRATRPRRAALSPPRALVAQPQPVPAQAPAPVMQPVPATPAPVEMPPAPAPVAPTPQAAPAPTPQAAPAQTPPAPREPEVTPAAAGQTQEAGADLGSMQDRLLGIVEDRTGYPRDMLDLDQNMEADLGIDSIKRVEIVGALLKSLPASVTEGLGDATEALSGQKTLRNMIDWLDQHVGGAQAPAEVTRPFDRAGVASESPREQQRTALPRFLMRAQPEPLGEEAAEYALPPGLYLVTEDRSGLAEQVMRSIEAGGGTTRLVPRSALEGTVDWESLAADLAAQGTVVGLVHLAAVGSATVDPVDGLSTWRAQTQVNEKSLFHLVRGLADGLRAGRVLAASALGGTFGRIAGDTALTAQGGAAGLLKSLREEWPQAKVHALDLDPTQAVEDQARQVLAELRLPGGRIEVGYPGGVRTLFRTLPAPFDPAASERLIPAADWVVLATGGARGITATVLEALAARGLTLVLAGRSSEPVPESPQLAALADESALRAHFIAQARAAGEQPRPVDIGRKVQGVLRERELRANQERLARLGARLDYRVADMRDETAVAGLLDDIYRRYGRLDGVVHAAGVIEDRLLTDKDPESWERVFDTKVDSAFLLAAHLRPQTLRFLVFFTSVAGRYGNSGQNDYAAANEVLNRMAWMLDRRWQGRVKVAAINWGPWAGSGMVSPETQRKFENLGVVLVDPDAGRDLFLDEIVRAAPDEVEVIAGMGPWEQRETEVAALMVDSTNPQDGGRTSPRKTPAEIRRSSSYPLLDGIERREGDKGALILHRTIGPKQDPYLLQHPLNEVPVVPAAVALELMAEAAADLWPGWQVNEVLDLRQLRGITLEQGDQDIDLVARASTHGDAGGFDAVIEILPHGKTFPPFYRATVRLAALPLDATSYDSVLNPKAFTRPMTEVYRDWLFHGPCFQTLTRIRGLDHHGIIAEIAPTAMASWLASGDHLGQPWLFDPGFVDSAPQLAIVWARALWDKTALPSRFGRVRRFGNDPLGPCRVHFLVHAEGSAGQVGDQIKADIAFVDQDGGLRLLIESMECSASDALNRLGGGWRGEIVV